MFREAAGTVPLQEWLDDLEATELKAYRKCLAFIDELIDSGNAMRRPHADYLRDGIYELRPTLNGIQYRIEWHQLSL